ncbi:hypothetical protein [Rheinheimera sp. F8]|uniref:hypothetical protein n=1 Tax=Rheinheimera sp. F8 TaxID=1763998 RepID=UPI0007449ABD|nr:hypothetical protein [Rheinheimera sp. F8]ALZ77197.1 hypothetical protein ATY27_16500 [Rheinheimera sp. F8]
MRHIPFYIVFALQPVTVSAQPTGVQDSFWQETAAGTLVALDAVSAGQSCDPIPHMATYHSRPLTGPGNYSRLQFSPCGFVFSGHNDAASVLQIRPRSPDASAHAQPSSDGGQPLWGWHVTTGSRADYQLYWLEPSIAELRSVQLTMPALTSQPPHWRSLWTATVSPAEQPWLSAEISAQRLADDPTADWLLLPGNAQVPIRLFNARTGVPRQLSVPAVNTSFALMPLADDPDQDGLAERLYLLSTEGLLLQYDWQSGSGWQVSTVADFRRSGWLFDGSWQRISARWPVTQGWQQGDVFILQGRDAHGYRLMVLRRPTGLQRVFDLTDIADNVDLNKAGWQRPLAGRPVTAAKILAGIMYLPLSRDPDSQGYDQLEVLQLFSGTPLYATATLTLPAAQQAPLRLVPANGKYQLWSAEQLIVPEVQRLDPSCLFCVETLAPEHLQQQQQLAQFRYEQVY